MSFGKSLLYSAGITASSVVLLTLTNGIPTAKQLLENGVTMFLIAFVVVQFWGGVSK